LPSAAPGVSLDDPGGTDSDGAESVALPPEMFGAPLTFSRGQLVVHPDPAGYLAVMGAIYSDGYRMAVDLCGVDRLLAPAADLPDGVAPGRFEVVVNVVSIDDRRRLRVRVQLPAEAPRLPSLFALYPGTEAMEREVYDFFGIVFGDHPDLSRILMPDDWEGHPLRKDYSLGRIPVQFKGTPPPR